MKKGTVLTIVFLGVVGYLSVSLIWTGSKHQCNVCITYNGIEVCQDVEGMDKNDVIQNGVSTACAGAANGTDRIHGMWYDTPHQSGLQGIVASVTLDPIPPLMG